MSESSSLTEEAISGLPKSHSLRVPWRSLAIGAVLWLGFIGVLTVQYYYASGTTWTSAIIRSIREWLPWVFLTPIVFALSHWFRLGRRRFLLHISIHVISCVTLVIAAEAMVVWVINPIIERQVGEEFTPRQPPLPISPERVRFNPDREPDFVAITIRKSRFWIPLYWVLVTAAHAFLYYQRLQERERRTLILEQRLSEARLNTLRSQLEPHFLFNALNAIATLVHKDPDKADTMIVRLCTLLRRFLDTRNTQIIPISTELEFLRAYLDIEKIRFDNRLEIEEKIEKGTLLASVPAMLLQPLAENAVRHGIEPAGRPGTLTISVQRSKDRLVIKIIDDGIGLRSTDTNTGPISLPRQRGHSVGMANARARLDALYGENGYSFSIEPGEKGGAVVALDIPFAESEDTSPPKIPDSA